MGLGARRLTRLVAISAAMFFVVAGVAYAATSITTPVGTPFVVPGDGSGNPLPFTVVATGYTAGAQVFVEQCDGVSPAAPGWSATENCDLGTSPAPATADQNGTATFDGQKIFKPFKGESPQSLFNCLGPNDPALGPQNGLTDYTNCKIRVSTNNSGSTADQAFLSIQLPNTVTATSTTTAAPTSTSTSTSTSTTVTTTTVVSSTTTLQGSTTTTIAPTTTTTVKPTTTTTTAKPTTTTTVAPTTTTTVKPTATTTTVKPTTTTTVEPTTTTTVKPTTTTVSAAGSTTTSSEVSGSSTSTTEGPLGSTEPTTTPGATIASGTGGLPFTGSSSRLPTAGIGMILVGAGLGLALGRRRRAV